MAEAIKLPAKLDLPAAVPLLNALQEVEGDVILDGSDVEHIGALCLQVLMSCEKTVTGSGHEFRLDNVTEAAEAQMGFMGVTPANLSGGAE